MTPPNWLEQINNSRKEMPQLEPKKFKEYLDEIGVGFECLKIDPLMLKASQGHFNRKKIESMRGQDLPPIFVSSDLYVLDGHHRWLAQSEKDKIDVFRIDASLNDILDIANEWKHAKYSGL